MLGGGTIDLDWSALTPALADKLVGILNTSLSSATRPSFIGPITVSSFEFGSAAPYIEIIDVRDIYPDFMEDDPEEDTPPLNDSHERILDEYEWVSQRDVETGSRTGNAHGPFPAPYNHLSALPSSHAPSNSPSVAPGFRPYNPSIGAPSSGVFTPGVPNLSRVHSFPRLHTPLLSHISGRAPGPNGGGESPSPYHLRGLNPSPLSTNQVSPSPAVGLGILGSLFSEAPYPAPPHDLPAPSPSPSPPASTSSQPNLQLHFRISYESNLRLALSTSLQIDYPAPMIMALPIKLCVIGLVLEGELVVAYEGERKRVHVCFLDELAGGSGPVPASASLQRGSGEGDDGSEADEDEEADEASRPPHSRSANLPPNPSSTPTNSRFAASTPSKPSPIGARLLPSIMLETEIGQEDKHVLRNVARVERFIQDVIRKSVEEEMVYPNFITLVLREAEAEGEGGDGGV